MSQRWRMSKRDQPGILRRSCACDAASNTSQRREAELWSWQPRHCRMPAFGVARFCSALGSRLLLLVGDSTMFQLAFTLDALLRASTCADQVEYAASDTLLHGCLGHFGRGGHWGHIVRTARRWPDVVVLNANAHVYDPSRHCTVGRPPSCFADTHYERTSAGGGGCVHPSKALDAFRLVLRDVLNTSAALHEHAKQHGKPLPRFIWRSAHPAHPDCARRSRNGTSGPRRFEGYTPETPYNWAQFPRMDEMAADAFARSGGRVSMMDTSLLYARHDAHMMRDDSPTLDCLHYCTPGPLDESARVLQLMLINDQQPSATQTTSVAHLPTRSSNCSAVAPSFTTLLDSLSQPIHALPVATRAAGLEVLVSETRTRRVVRARLPYDSGGVLDSPVSASGGNQRARLSGVVTGTIGDGVLASPHGLAVIDQSSTLLVADAARHRVAVFNLETGAYSHDVADDGRCRGPVALLHTRRRTGNGDGLDGGSGAELGGSRLFVACSADNVVQEYKGDVARPFPSGAPTMPLRPVLRFGASSTSSSGAPDALSNPHGIALVPPAGDSGESLLLAVADFGHHRIAMFDANSARFVRALGAKGRREGELYQPYGVVFLPEHGARRGVLIVTEFGNRRLQVFDPTAQASPTRALYMDVEKPQPPSCVRKPQGRCGPILYAAWCHNRSSLMVVDNGGRVLETRVHGQ